jgi:hypothetical protein
MTAVARELTGPARHLIAEGYKPDVLCAPIALFVPFTMDSSLAIDWNTSPTELPLVPGGPSLKIRWSSGIAPLDRFVVFYSRKTLWRAKLDPKTDHRLTRK